MSPVLAVGGRSDPGRVPGDAKAAGDHSMTDGSLVTRNVLATVLKERATEGAETNAVQQLATREPVLAAYVSERIVAVSGKLALSGAPSEVVRGSYDDLLEIVTVTARAIWKGQDEFWKDVDLSVFVGHRRRRVRRRTKAGGGSSATPPLI